MLSVLNRSVSYAATVTKIMDFAKTGGLEKLPLNLDENYS